MTRLLSGAAGAALLSLNLAACSPAVSPATANPPPVALAAAPEEYSQPLPHYAMLPGPTVVHYAHHGKVHHKVVGVGRHCPCPPGKVHVQHHPRMHRHHRYHCASVAADGCGPEAG